MQVKEQQQWDSVFDTAGVHILFMEDLCGHRLFDGGGSEQRSCQHAPVARQLRLDQDSDEGVHSICGTPP